MRQKLVTISIGFSGSFYIPVPNPITIASFVLELDGGANKQVCRKNAFCENCLQSKWTYFIHKKLKYITLWIFWGAKMMSFSHQNNFQSSSPQFWSEKSPRIGQHHRLHPLVLLAAVAPHAWQCQSFSSSLSLFGGAFSGGGNHSGCVLFPCKLLKNGPHHQL